MYMPTFVNMFVVPRDENPGEATAGGNSLNGNLSIETRASHCACSCINMIKTPYREGRRTYFKKKLVLHNELSLEGTMASAEREPIKGVWGGAPSGVQGQSPWSGVQAAKPPEAGDIFILKVHFLRSFCGILHWCNGCKFL